MNNICPYCGKEMALGYIQSGRGIAWRNKIVHIAAFSALSRSAVRLSSESLGPFSGNAVEAFRCADCKKVVIDYGEDSTDES